MATSITIRNVPDETRDELAARAASTHRSLQEYLRAALIDFARRPDPAVLMAQIRERNGPIPAAMVLREGARLVRQSSRIRGDLILTLWEILEAEEPTLEGCFCS